MPVKFIPSPPWRLQAFFMLECIFACQETVLQIIGTSETVPAAVVDLSLLYQGDPSLPSSLHLNYSHAHFVATPPPPPTPPPSPALSSSCGNRVPPHFAHPAGLLHLPSGQHHFGNSSSWSHTPQPTPMLDGLRASGSSQASMLCMPPTVGRSDSIPAAQVSQTECQLVLQKQGFKRPSSYSLPSSGNGCLGGWQNCKESAAPSIPSLAGERLKAELQQHLKAAIVAAAAADAAPAQHQPSSIPTNSNPPFWTQQQQSHNLREQQGQPQQQLTAPRDWPDLQLLSQLCIAQPQQISRANEQPRTLPQQHAEQGQFHQLDELPQPILQRQVQHAQQEHPNRPSTSLLDEMSGSRPSSTSCPLSLQQLQQHIQALHLQYKDGEQQKDNVTSVSSFISRAGQTDEQKQLLLTQQVQQQLQQHLQQELQRQQLQTLQQSQVYRPPQHLDIPPVQRWTPPQAASLHGEQHYPLTCSESGRGQSQQLQQFQSLRERALVNTETANGSKIQHLDPELVQQPQLDAPIEPLSPVPPPQWAQIPQHQLQEKMQHVAQPQSEMRMLLGSSQCSPSGASPGLSAQPPQRHSSALLLEAHDPINFAAVPQHPEEAASTLTQPALEGPVYPALRQLVQSEEEICDPLAVRKLLEDLLKIISLSTTDETPDSQCHEPKVGTLTHTADTTLHNGAPENVQQQAREVEIRTEEGVAASPIQQKKVLCT